MGERGTRRICLEIRDHGAWLYFESSASKKHCQALITYTFFFLEARVEIRKWCLWEGKLSGRNYPRADAGRVSEASEWESRASLTCWGPRYPETKKQLRHLATAVPLLTPTLLRSRCRPAPHSPAEGKTFPLPRRWGWDPPARGGGVAAVQAGPEKRWVHEKQPGACASGGHQLHHHRLGGPGGSKGGRPSPSGPNSPRILGLSFWQDRLPWSPQQQDPQA